MFLLQKSYNSYTPSVFNSISAIKYDRKVEFAEILIDIQTYGLEILRVCIA